MTDDPTRTPLGWWSRGYLPHRDAQGIIQSVTFRLADSLPEHVLTRLRQEVHYMEEIKRNIALRKRIEAWNDEGHGCSVLGQPEAARIVRDAMLHHQGERYHLHAWVIMPNHVHALIEPDDAWPLRKIIGSWKSWTGSKLAPMMPRKSVEFGSSRRVWQNEFWDRYIRNERHYQAALAYIIENPLKAGLVARPEDYPWSSAYAGSATL